MIIDLATKLIQLLSKINFFKKIIKQYLNQLLKNN